MAYFLFQYPNLVLFFMAGGSNNPKETIKEAAVLRQHAIHMVVLGMNNNVNLAEAYAIATYPQTFNFRANVVDIISTPEGLAQSAAALVEILCNSMILFQIHEHAKRYLTFPFVIYNRLDVIL